MHVVIAGAHGQVARRLTRRLTAAGHRVTGIVRNPAHCRDVAADGATPVVVDLERASAKEVSLALDDADAVVFAAGAGPGSGPERKDTVDRRAAVVLAEAAQRADIPRYLLVSSMGVDLVRGGGTPDGVDEVFVAYLRAKLAAEEDVRSRDLEWVVLRPGGLTDDPGTGRVTLTDGVDRGQVSRDDVAAVLHTLLETPAVSRQVLELVAGEVPVEQAVRAVAS